jgi:hypothetical protein
MRKSYLIDNVELTVMSNAVRVAIDEVVNEFHINNIVDLKISIKGTKIKAMIMIDDSNLGLVPKMMVSIKGKKLELCQPEEMSIPIDERHDLYVLAYDNEIYHTLLHDSVATKTKFSKTHDKPITKIVEDIKSKLTEDFKIFLNLEKISQAILSTKHITSSAESTSLGLTDDMRKILVVKNNDNNYALNVAEFKKLNIIKLTKDILNKCNVHVEANKTFAEKMLISLIKSGM